MPFKLVTTKYLGKSEKYRYVYLRRCRTTRKILYLFKKRHKGKTVSKMYDNERSAALAVDKFLISVGLEPVNILKKILKTT